MKAGFILILVIACAAESRGQSPARRAEQFYTNGHAAGAWSANSRQGVQTTLWFARNPLEDTVYRQMLVIVYDDNPSQVFYVDSATRLFVGRLDLKTEQFSLLPPHARRERLSEIDDGSFAPPGGLPRVAELFEPLAAGKAGNESRLALPPPTPQFPRLENSKWDTCYMSADRFQIRSTVELAGDRGTYRLTDKPGTGRLSDIRYDRDDENHVVHGNWALGQSSGWFKFRIPEDNLNVFWGEFGFEPGRVMGAWSGIRRTNQG